MQLTALNPMKVFIGKKGMEATIDSSTQISTVFQFYLMQINEQN